MPGRYQLIALTGAALVLASRGKKKRRKRPAAPAEVEELSEEDLFGEWEEEGEGGALEEEDLFEEIGEIDEDVEVPLPGPADRSPATPAEVVLALEHPDQKAHLGGLYQIRPGDTPLIVAREALYGTRDPINDPEKRAAAIELAVRIDCSPWNQANYGVSPEVLDATRTSIKNGWSKVGVSFKPIYVDNRSRMIAGKSPSAARGNNFAFIYIPMVNLDLLDTEGLITTRGMNYPDTERGRGHNMIDPPDEILRLGFDDVFLSEVGCNLPEGDFRKTMEVNG